MKAFLGDYVQTLRHYNTGRVFAKYYNFSETRENMDWFNKQEPKIPLSTLNEPWYGILCNGGGAIVVPELDLIEISTKPINDSYNPHEHFYFNTL